MADVEKVARAICYAAYRYALEYDEATARQCEENHWPEFTPQAEAALAVMGEREAVGFFATLTPVQQAAALAYRGPENLMPSDAPISPHPEAVDEMVKAGIAASEALDAIDAYHKRIRPEQPRIPQSVISALYAAYQVAHKAKRETPDV